MKSISVASSGERIDIYLFHLFPDLTRSRIQSLIKSQNILLNNNPTKPSFILKGNEEIQYDFQSIPEKSFNEIKAQKLDVNITYEDNDIIIIDKCPGMVVHPGAGNYSGTILNGLIDRIDYSQFESNPGIVHRLDKETSGIMIVAKNFKTHAFLSKQFESREVKKIYRAIVWGKCNESGFIEGNIIRNDRNRKSFILSKSDKGRYSKTTYKLINQYGPLSYLEIMPSTGRTHQIRVHMKSIGHPIIFDDDYGGGIKMIKSFHVKYTKLLKSIFKSMDRVALHAKSIKFLHPNKNIVEYDAPIPDDFKKVINLAKTNEPL
ncbi:MAG: hypothetical protein CBD21_02470 [bacterium TMED161]|nr:RNA pseudouridine synthase [Candidatus Neomarinimicrobiota bacterium]OUW21033.1 MAG: hypothetical protein CBD21_02470 [bacterium TMED161]